MLLGQLSGLSISAYPADAQGGAAVVCVRREQRGEFRGDDGVVFHQ